MQSWGDCMEYDVSKDRDIYIGGSDIPAIMGISTFKTRFQLLLEKAGLEENGFTGNKYTVYGQQLEPQIRDYINSCDASEPPFVPNRVIAGDFRAHTDGFNGKRVLEIKTTSHIYSELADYRVYLVQLLKYMEVNGVKDGLLAVYERPSDFCTEFDSARLIIYDVSLADWEPLLAEINYEIDRFRADLERLKKNPLLSEEDFQPSELVTLSQKVIKFEQQLAELKAIEAECKKAKATLYEEMKKHGVKSWDTPNGTKITLVADTKGSVKTVRVFDVERFTAEYPATAEQFMKDVEQKTPGKRGYVKITLPK